MAGWVQGSLTSEDSSGGGVFVQKYDIEGEEIWTRQFGSDEPVDAYDINISEAGQLYIVGRIECGSPVRCGELPDQVNTRSHDAWIREYDKSV